MMIVEILITATFAYLALGFVFAVAFAWRGVQVVDADARNATWGFRVLLVPGATLLWPILLRRWLRGESPPLERTAHKVRAGDGR